MADETVQWQGTQPFYDHLKDLWEKQSYARFQLNSASGHEKLDMLEQWYESLQIIVDILSYYMQEKELLECDELIRSVERLTHGHEISESGLEQDQLYDIRATLRRLNRIVWMLQGKYHLTPKKGKNFAAGDSWRK